MKFSRIWFGALSAALLLPSAAWAGEAPSTLSEAQVRAAEHNKPLLIDFFTEW